MVVNLCVRESWLDDNQGHMLGVVEGALHSTAAGRNHPLPAATDDASEDNEATQARSWGGMRKQI